MNSNQSIQVGPKASSGTLFCTGISIGKENAGPFSKGHSFLGQPSSIGHIKNLTIRLFEQFFGNRNGNM